MIPGYLVVARLDGETTEVEGPGGEIWECLIDGVSVEGVVEKLVNMYGTLIEVVRSDVESFVALLLERDLITERKDRELE